MLGDKINKINKKVPYRFIKFAMILNVKVKRMIARRDKRGLFF